MYKMLLYSKGDVDCLQLDTEELKHPIFLSPGQNTSQAMMT
jgi:hypothetical protein